MFSRLFKFGMVAGGRPPVYPHMATNIGDVFKYDPNTDAFSTFGTVGVGNNSTSSVSYSPDGKFLAITASATNGVYYLYKRTKSGYTAVTLPGTIPSVNAYDIQWSGDGQYLIMGLSASPYVVWWKRNADDTFTAMPAPAVLPASAVYSIASSPDGKYIAMGLYSAPFLIVYKIVNGVLTQIANPATLPGAYAYKIAFLTNTLFVFPPNSGSYSPSVYSIDSGTDAISLMSTPAIVARNTRWMAATPDGKHFVFLGGTAPDFYKFDGISTFSKLTNPSTAVANSSGAAYSADNKYLAVIGSTSPYLQVYKLVSDTHTALSGIPAIGNNRSAVAFAPGLNV